MIKLTTIKRNPDNPRLIKDEKFHKLCESLKSFGKKMMPLRPIVIDENNIILGGNMRFKALKEIGYKEVPDDWIKRADDLTDDQKREFIIKDNVGFGEWDFDILSNEWDVDQLEQWGMDIDNIEMDDITEVVEDDFEMPEEIKTDIVVGDLFEIGKHKLLCGSSLETDNWLKLFNEKLCDLVVTDPPYNVALGMETLKQAKARNRRTDGLTIKNDKMNDEEFYKFLYDFYTALGSFTKPGGAWYVWHADSESINFRKAMQDAGIMCKQGLIWKKSSLVMGRQDYQWMHEPCLYGWKEGGSHNWYSDRKQTTILEFDKPSRNAEHPTMKPIPLISYQIKNSSKKGDIVADAFLGSGTTMVASHQLNRICYGTELDPKYCQVIVDRMIKLDPKLLVKRNGKPYLKQLVES